MKLFKERLYICNGSAHGCECKHARKNSRLVRMSVDWHRSYENGCILLVSPKFSDRCLCVFKPYLMYTVSSLLETAEIMCTGDSQAFLVGRTRGASVCQGKKGISVSSDQTTSKSKKWARRGSKIYADE